MKIPKKLADKIKYQAEGYEKGGHNYAYVDGAFFAATEILKEVEKLFGALVKSNCDCSNYAECDRCSALLSWSNFIGQNQVDKGYAQEQSSTDQKEVDTK
jgi:hypothetical protein